MTDLIPENGKILVRFPNWIGDVVLATPALRALHASRIEEIGGSAVPVYELVLQGKAAFEAGQATGEVAAD